MIMSKVMKMLSENKNHELEKVIIKIKKNDEIKAKEHKNRSTYKNPCTIRLGVQAQPQQKRAFYNLIQKEYCPI